MARIVRREQFSELSFLWEIEAPDVAAAAEPGHFVMLRLHEDGERIPLTVADFDRERGTVTVVVQALGKTTLAMRDQYAAGDEVLDFVGPLGLPVPGLGSTVTGIISGATSSIDQVLASVLAMLGVGVGQADVWVSGIRCDGAVLVN